MFYCSLLMILDKMCGHEFILVLTLKIATKLCNPYGWIILFGTILSLET